MAKRKGTVVDEVTGEVLGETEVAADGQATAFEEGYTWRTPQEAIQAVSKQRRRCDNLESKVKAAKDEAKELGAELDKEESVLRLMLRSLQQLKLFALLLCAGLLVGLVSSCGHATAAPQLGGAPGGWDDLLGRQDDFEVRPIEPGVALLIDKRTGNGWILAGNSQSWQAIEPVGGL